MSLDKMNKQDRAEALADICHQYYNEGKNQSDIAKEYNTTRFKISKYLQEARNENIVSISINTSKKRNSAIEKLLCEKYGLKQAVVINTQYLSYSETLWELGRFGAYYLNHYINDTSTVGLMWGKTLQAAIEQLPRDRQTAINAIPLTGMAPTSRLSADNISLVRNTAAAYSGKYHHIYAPLYTNDSNYSENWQSDPLHENVVKLSKAMDIVLTGLGGETSLPNKSEIWKPYVETGDTVSESAIGSIFGRLIDKSGNIIDSSLNKKLIALDMTDILSASTRICLVQGKHKIDMLKGVLAKNYINVLITDVNTALPIVYE